MVPVVFIGCGSLAYFLSDASLPGSVGQWLGFHGMMGKTTLFSSVPGKLHLFMFDPMTRFIIIIFLNGKMSKCLNMVRLAILSLRLSCRLFI